MNRDNAESARDMGDAAMRQGDFVKALRLFQKSKSLFALDGIDARIAAAKNAANKPKDAPSSSSTSTPQAQRTQQSSATSSTSSGDFTSEQEECVQRIVRTKCYYEVLQIAKGDVNENELKKGAPAAHHDVSA